MQPLGAGVPGRDDRARGREEHGVAGPLDDGGEPGGGLPGFLQFGVQGDQARLVSVSLAARSAACCRLVASSASRLRSARRVSSPGSPWLNARSGLALVRTVRSASVGIR